MDIIMVCHLAGMLQSLTYILLSHPSRSAFFNPILGNLALQAQIQIGWFEINRLLNFPAAVTGTSDQIWSEFQSRLLPHDYGTPNYIWKWRIRVWYVTSMFGCHGHCHWMTIVTELICRYITSSTCRRYSFLLLGFVHLYCAMLYSFTL